MWTDRECMIAIAHMNWCMLVWYELKRIPVSGWSYYTECAEWAAQHKVHRGNVAPLFKYSGLATPVLAFHNETTVQTDKGFYINPVLTFS